MTSVKSDCGKFSPNIFSKTKCQNCFKGKEAHTPEALESNRVTRKVLKCGYLFVAPDWDFSVPINRTKRWQRRWFVLYDDGELTYSVDEHPETVPQAIIDMNNVLEVTDAEDVTGNQFALAITASDKVHFVKGTCREDIKWWYEELLQFPHNTVCGKYKRNATFPGGKSVSSPQKFSDDDVFLQKGLSHSPNQLLLPSSTCTFAEFKNKMHSPSIHHININEDLMEELPKFSVQKQVTKSLNADIHNEKNFSRKISDENDSTPDKEVIPRSVREKSVRKLHSGNFDMDKSSSDANKDIKGQTNQYFPLNRLKSVEGLDYEKGNIRRYIKREYHGVKSHRSHSDGVAKMIPPYICKEQEFLNDWKGKQVNNKETYSVPSQRNYHHNPVYILLSNSPTIKKSDSVECIPQYDESSTSLVKDSSTKLKSSTQSWPTGLQMRHDKVNTPNAERTNLERNSVAHYNGKHKNGKVLNEHNMNHFDVKVEEHPVESVFQVRGDPDGCGLDTLLSTCTSAQELSADEESLSFKRGWLMKQNINNEWHKHWFVLRNSALTYYSDPVSEDAGVLDGMLDMRLVKNVAECYFDHKSAFSIIMKDGISHLLSAGTSKQRTSWIHSICKAANLSVSSVSKDHRSKHHEPQISFHSEAEDMNFHNQDISSADFEASKFLSHSKFLTTSNNDKQNHISSQSVAYTLPPSPPLTRTAMSRVKERARSRSTSRCLLNKFQNQVSLDGEINQADTDEAVSDNSCSNLLSTHIKEKSTQGFSSVTLKNNQRMNMDSVHQTDTSKLHEYKIKLKELKDKLEDCSWFIWVDVSRFCKEIEKKLLKNEQLSATKDLQMNNTLELSLKHEELQGEMKEVSDLLSSLCEIEGKLHNAQAELHKSTEVYFMKGNMTYFKNTKYKVNEGQDSVSKDDINILKDASSKYYLLTQQLCRVKEENRILKKDLKEAQSNYDELEIHCINIRQNKKQADELHHSNLSLMTSKIDDLTKKLFSSERNLLQMKQKATKLEQKQERRRSSLKGKEGLTLSKEYEMKLTELEGKIGVLEAILQTTENEGITAKGHLSSGNDYKVEETHGLLLRLNNLDKRVKEASGTSEKQAKSFSNSTSKPNICLELKPQVEIAQNLAESYLSFSATDSLNLNILSSENEIHNKTDILYNLRQCLKHMSIKVNSLVSWLKSILNMVYNQLGVSDISSLDPNENFSQYKLIKDLHILVQIVERFTSHAHNLPSEKDGNLFKNILYSLLLLQEITTSVFKLSDFENYKNAILNHQLLKSEEILSFLESHVQMAMEKNTSFHKDFKLIDALLIFSSHFYSNSCTYLHTIHSDSYEWQSLICKYERVEKQQHDVYSMVHNFKQKSIKTLLTVVSDFVDKNVQSSNDSRETNLHSQYSTGKLIEINISNQISDVIALVTQTFNCNLSALSNRITFLSRDIVGYVKWKKQVCITLQQEMEKLSLDMKSSVQSLEITYLPEPQDVLINYYVISSVISIAQVIILYCFVNATLSCLQESITTFSSGIADEDCPFKVDEKSLDSYIDSLLQLFHDKVNNQAELSGHIMNDIANSHNFLISNGIAMFAQETILNIISLKKLYKIAVEERSVREEESKYLKGKLDVLKKKEQHYKENCSKCTELKQKVVCLQKEIEELSSLPQAESTCEQCNELRLELQELAKNMNCVEIDEIKNSLKSMVVYIIRKKEEFLGEERKRLEKECHSIQMRVRNVEMKYEEEIKSLQTIYKQHLAQNFSAINEETVRCRYQSEIEQLKCLCEKGMLAMEASYQRILKDLQQSHQHEISQLLAEKEKLIAEEVHATSIALHAIRKAHKEELQQQAVKLKTEMQKDVNAQHVIEAVRNEYESALDGIKKEILALTDKYSFKCLESALLAEKLELVSQQLQKTNVQVIELLAKNSQLQAHLASDSAQKQEELKGYHFQKLEHFQFLHEKELPPSSTNLPSSSS